MMIKILKNLAVLLLLAALISLLGSCSRTSNLKEAIAENHDDNIDQFILDKLKDNRVVMLADGGHGQYIYLQRVISVLNGWLDALDSADERNRDIPRKLFLIIETDSSKVKKIKQYFKSGRPFDLIGPMGFMAEQFTTSVLEYYSDLGEFSARVERHNSQADGSSKIFFDIFGPEKVINLNGWSFAKRDSFFIYERDIYSSNQIIDLLRKNPDAKALIYYGSAHFNRELAKKKTTTLEGESYYLAHYLDSYFKDSGGVYLISQAPISIYSSDKDAFRLPGQSYIIENKKIRDAFTSDLAAKRQFDFDASIIYLEFYGKERSISYCKSNGMTDFIIQNLDNHDSLTDEFYRAFMAQAQRYLTIVSGSEIDTSRTCDPAIGYTILNRWKSWYDKTRLDVVKDIESLALWTRLIDHMQSSEGKQIDWYETLIASSLGVSPNRNPTMTLGERVNTYREYLKDGRKKIIVENLVHMLWVATDSEKAEAIEVLKKETGQDLASPKEWLQWWRKNGDKLEN